MKMVKVWGIATYVMGSDDHWDCDWFLSKEERDEAYKTRVVSSPSPVKKVRCRSMTEQDYNDYVLSRKYGW